MNLVVKTTQQSDGTIKAWCPALPGCQVTAGNDEEVHERLQTAIRGYLASMDVVPPADLQTRREGMLTVR